MNPKVRIITIGILSLLSILILFTASFFLYRINSKKEVNAHFESLISEIDSAIENRFFGDLISLFKTADHFISSEEDTLRYIKRVLEYSIEAEEFSFLLKSSEKALNSYPENKKLSDIYIFSLLKNGKTLDIHEFEKINRKYKIPEKFDEYLNLSDGVNTGSGSVFQSAVWNNSISSYLDLYKLSGNDEFLENAVLLYMKSGNYDEAEKLLEDYNTQGSFRLKFLLYLDLGQYKDAENILDKYDLGYDPEIILLFKQDILLSQKKYSEAGDRIIQFIEMYPDFSSVPYCNALWLSEYTEIKDIDSIATSAQEYFPDDIAATYRVAEYFLDTGETVKALEILQKYIKKNPGDSAADLIISEIQGIQDPDRHINALRNYVNLNESDTQVAVYLAWYLFEYRKISQLENYLDFIEERYGTDSWFYFFRGLSSGIEGDEEAASVYLEKAALEDKYWETVYNLAVIHEFNRDYESALSYYQSAENIITGISPETFKIKSMIRTSLAELLMKTRNYERAESELKNSLELDNYNLKAHMLMEKLESIGY